MIVDDIFTKNKDKYESLIKAFQIQNDLINLSSFNDSESILNKHIIDSLNIFQFEYLQRQIQQGKESHIADIGTGGGFPGLALAIALPNSKFFLIESITKKCTAVQNILDQIQIKNVTILNMRAEDVNDSFNITLSRAVSSFETIFRLSYRITSKNGNMYFYKSLKEEIKGYNNKIVYNISDDNRVIYEFSK